VQRSFAHNQVRNCYSVFSEQFDLYPAEHVIWEPYAENIIQTRYPGGLSIMCTRDAAYWMTRSKIIFDVSVEEMAQQRVMRQFGLCQLVDPPRADSPLPANIHKYVYAFFHSRSHVFVFMHLLIVFHIAILG
jgi:hypothetical protein